MLKTALERRRQPVDLTAPIQRFSARSKSHDFHTPEFNFFGFARIASKQPMEFPNFPQADFWIASADSMPTVVSLYLYRVLARGLPSVLPIWRCNSAGKT